MYWLWIKSVSYTHLDVYKRQDANYVREIHRKEYPLRSRRSTHVKELAEEDFNEEMLHREEDNYPIEEMTDTVMTELLMPLENISLEDQLANIGAVSYTHLVKVNINNTAPSNTDKERYTSAKKSIWPGVS